MKCEEHLLDQAKVYCRLDGIPFNNGNIPIEHVKKLEIFLRAQFKCDRNRNRKIKEANKLHISTGIDLSKFEKLQSPIEEYMYMALENFGLSKHCRPQYKIGTKCVDFAFPIAFLAVECDGKEYHFTDKLQIEADQKRDKYLARKGWTVLHFDGLIIRRNIEKCIEEITEFLNPFIETCNV